MLNLSRSTQQTLPEISFIHEILRPKNVFFFTVVTVQRRQILAQETAIDLLRQAFCSVMVRYPFKIEAASILPDHLHMVRIPFITSRLRMVWRSRRENSRTPVFTGLCGWGWLSKIWQASKGNG